MTMMIDQRGSLFRKKTEGHCNHRKCPNEGYKNVTWVEGAKLQREVKVSRYSNTGVQTNPRGCDRSVLGAERKI